MARPGNKEFLSMRTEFNMMAHDIERLNIILQRCDEYSIMVYGGNMTKIIEYLSSLMALYRTMRPLIAGKIRTDYDDRFHKLKLIIYKEKKYNWDTLQELENLHTSLLDSRQLLGLGIAAQKVGKAERDLKI